MARVVAAALLLAMALSAGCPSLSPSAPVCQAGLQVECACPGGAKGVQVCAADGSQWLACEQCPVAGEDGTGSPDALVLSETDQPADTETLSDGGIEDTTTTGGGFDGQLVTDGVASDATPSEPCTDCGYGALKGIVCAPSEQVFVSNAILQIQTFDCDGNAITIETLSKPDGTYLMPEVPCGQHTVHVKAGSFTNSYTVAIDAGETTDITGVGKKLCFNAQSVKIGVWWGQWDHQHDLLEKLGFDFDYYEFEWEFFNDVDPDTIEAVQVLRSEELLSQYQILFFNCGSAALEYVHMYPEIGKNLKAFVLAGGSIYASDLAWAYIEDAFPEAFDFYGSDDLPNGPQSKDGPQQAEGNQDVPATVVDPVLAETLGLGTLTAVYGPGPLIMVDSVAAGGQTHVVGPVVVTGTGDAFNPPTKVAGPLVMSRRPAPGAGMLVYTTFHNDEQADEVILKTLYYLVFLL